FNYEWSDQEYNQVKHMQETFHGIIEEMAALPCGTSLPKKKAMALPIRAKLSTSVVPPGWGMIRTSRCSTNIVRHTRFPTYLSLTGDPLCLCLIKILPGRF